MLLSGHFAPLAVVHQVVTVCRSPGRGNSALASTARRRVRRASITPRQKERGPSMYEMEGPRLAFAALACRSPGHRAPRGYHSPRDSAMVTGAGTPVTWSDQLAGPRFPELPPGRARLQWCVHFYCLPRAPHKAFAATAPRFFGHPQDICRLSPVRRGFPPPHPQVYPQPGVSPAGGTHPRGPKCRSCPCRAWPS
jgi:hypothetical protein